MEYYSPLRYPGGKGKVSEYFKRLFEDNLLCDGTYIEPYAGGSSVALSLLFNEYASNIVINDLDRSIFSFWHSVLNETEALCKLINDTSVTVENWKLQKEIQNNKHNCSLLDVGFATFFLNRTNRSGILNAGIIGGKEQTGNWKIDARYNKTELIKRINKIALYKSRITLFNLDAVVLIRQLKKTLPKRALFYFDPPYYVKGKDLYLNFYNHNDHTIIANEISNITHQKWVVTYDNVSPIKNLYSNFQQVDYSLNYSAGDAAKGNEVMIFSNNTIITKHHLLHNF